MNAAIIHGREPIILDGSTSTEVICEGFPCLFIEHEDADALFRVASRAREPSGRIRYIMVASREECVERLGTDPAKVLIDRALVDSLLAAEPDRVEAELAKVAEAVGVERVAVDPKEAR